MIRTLVVRCVEDTTNSVSELLVFDEIAFSCGIPRNEIPPFYVTFLQNELVWFSFRKDRKIANRN